MKHNKFDARFGEDYLSEWPYSFLRASAMGKPQQVTAAARKRMPTFPVQTKADFANSHRRRNDRRRKGRAIRKERRQVLAALRMMPELVDTARRVLDNLMRWVRQFADLVRSGEPVDLSAVA